MESQNKLVKLIAYINELTQKGKLRWVRDEPPPPIVTSYDNKVDFIYITRFENKLLRIYKERFKNWYEEDRYVWEDRVILDFTDDEGRSIWEFPDLPGLWDLLESVKYQEADVDGFISEIMSKHKLD